MEWLSENWLFLLVAIGFIAMHAFGHGGHGGHGSHGGHGRRDKDDEESSRREAPTQRGGHRH